MDITKTENEQENGTREDDGDTFEDAVEDLNSDQLNDIDKETSVNKDDDDERDEEGDIDEYLEPENPLSEDEKQERKRKAEEDKRQGNEYYKRSEFPEARELYTAAIQTCPPEFKNEKSIFYSNRAACLVRMDLFKDAIRDCSKALDLNPEYLKARLRRAQCYEHEEQLEEALEDYQKIFEVDKSCLHTREALRRLPEQIKIKQEKMKEEMIGKLKELGNVFLKPFGLSTQNFNLQQDPDSGGYSVNFQQNR